ncbi:MAG: hypothetical protein AB1Y25_12275 [Cycloclasticus sp.]
MTDHVHVENMNYTASSRGVGKEHLLRNGDLNVKLTQFKKGDEIPMHRHTDEKHEKLIVKGKVEFTDTNGTVDILGEGILYMCGSGATYYYGKVLEDTIILVIESSDSVIEFPKE